MTKHLNLLPGETLEIKGFDSLGEPTITREDDGSLVLTFNFMPPDNGTYEENLDMDIFDNFDSELSKVLGVEVVWEDREFFNIPSPKKDTIDILKNYLENFWKNHSENNDNNIQKELTQQNNTEQTIKAITGRKVFIISSLINNTLKSLKKYLENIWQNRSENKENKTPNDRIQPINNIQPNQTINLNSLKKDVLESIQTILNANKMEYVTNKNEFEIKIGENILIIQNWFDKPDPGIYTVSTWITISNNTMNKYLGGARFLYNNPLKYAISTYKIPEVITNRLKLPITDRVSKENHINFLKKLIENNVLEWANNHSTLNSLDINFNLEVNTSINLDYPSREIYGILTSALVQNSEKIKIIDQRLSNISQDSGFIKDNYIPKILLENLCKDSFLTNEELNYFIEKHNM